MGGGSPGLLPSCCRRRSPHIALERAANGANPRGPTRSGELPAGIRLPHVPPTPSALASPSPSLPCRTEVNCDAGRVSGGRSTLFSPVRRLLLWACSARLLLPLPPPPPSGGLAQAAPLPENKTNLVMPLPHTGIGDWTTMRAAQLAQFLLAAATITCAAAATEYHRPRCALPHCKRTDRRCRACLECHRGHFASRGTCLPCSGDDLPNCARCAPCSRYYGAGACVAGRRCSHCAAGFVLHRGACVRDCRADSKCANCRRSGVCARCAPSEWQGREGGWMLPCKGACVVPSTLGTAGGRVAACPPSPPPPFPPPPFPSPASFITPSLTQTLLWMARAAASPTA